MTMLTFHTVGPDFYSRSYEMLPGILHFGHFWRDDTGEYGPFASETDARADFNSSSEDTSETT